MRKATSFISRFWIRYHLSHTLQFNQPLSATHSKSLSFLRHLLIHLLHAVSLLVLRSLGEEGSTASATYTSRLSFLLVPRPKFKPLVYPSHFQRQQKNAPNLCAKGIGRSLAFLSSAISTSTFAQLADGSRTSVR
jgi:hypothetical protein